MKDIIITSLILILLLPQCILVFCLPYFSYKIARVQNQNHFSWPLLSVFTFSLSLLIQIHLKNVNWNYSTIKTSNLLIISSLTLSAIGLWIFQKLNGYTQNFSTLASTFNYISISVALSLLIHYTAIICIEFYQNVKLNKDEALFSAAKKHIIFVYHVLFAIILNVSISKLNYGVFWSWEPVQTWLLLIFMVSVSTLSIKFIYKEISNIRTIVVTSINLGPLTMLVNTILYPAFVGSGLLAF